MANKILNLIFKATDKATPTLDKIQGGEGKGGIGGITQSLKGLINTATMAMGAVAALGGALAATFDKYRGYIDDVSRFNSMIDGTAEETSMLVRIMQDFNVTEDTMLAAMRTLAKQGYDPTIASLIEIRDKLDATSSASERLAMAQTLIGEQGIKQILPMFDALGDELDSYVEDFDEGLIVTQEMIDRNIEMEKAVADMTAAWDKAVLTFGDKVSPAILNATNDLVRLMDDGLKTVAVEDFTAAWERWARLFSGDIPWRAFLVEIPEGIDLTTRSLQGFEEAIDDVTTAQEDMNEGQLWALGLSALEAGRTDQAAKYFNEAAGIHAKADAYRDLRAAWMGGQGIGAAIAAGGLPGADWRTYTGPTVPSSAGSGGGGSGGHGWYDSSGNFNPTATRAEADAAWRAAHGYAEGGSFIVGGFGGTDSQRVSFMATPGEPVTVGGGNEDVAALVMEVRRLVNRLPTMMKDAVERVV